ncbi:hypothetical protein ASU28_13395 [Lactiplantibacillus paraplantarum]|nr:hypothetical protein ASU28_13395 [Lactiplantibacillus paraplantarum]OAX75275.1 hypothetical protein A0U96_10685 [Lactiplantibacillus plantarum]RDG11651.1 hypothetical protein DQM08_07340 [Lactiplantibacillus paraplantarum]
MVVYFEVRLAGNLRRYSKWFDSCYNSFAYLECPFEDNFVEYRVRPMLFFYFLLYQKQVWKNPKIFPDLLCF